MVITETGRSGTALLLGGIGSSPTYVGIGSGSQAVSVSTTGLKAHTDRNLITGSADTSTLKNVVWTTDFSSTEMSGTSLKEFGLFNLSSGGKCWHVENFTGITFDGSNELQIAITWVVF